MSEAVAERLRGIYAGRRFWAMLGIELVDAEPGWSRIRLRPTDSHLNTNNVVHGGVISAMADITAGVAVRALRGEVEHRERPHATSDLHISYLSAATGAELFGEGKVTKAGRTLIFVEIEITDEHDRKIARAMATYAIASRPPKSREESDQIGE